MLWISKIVSLSAIYTILPRYITATLSLIWCTTAKLWVTNMYIKPSCLCKSLSKFKLFKTVYFQGYDAILHGNKRKRKLFRTVGGKRLKKGF